VVEDNNLGEVLFFNTRLGRVSSVIPLDTLMGLTAEGWSSGGDIMCQFTARATAGSRSSPGPGCPR